MTPARKLKRSDKNGTHLWEQTWTEDRGLGFVLTEVVLVSGEKGCESARSVADEHRCRPLSAKASATHA